MMQHVMYKDVMDNRKYIEYPRFANGFDASDPRCTYSYGENKDAMRAYLAKYTSVEYLKNYIIPEYKGKIALTDDQIDNLIAFFSMSNPSIRLAVYSGVTINYDRIMQDISIDPSTTIMQVTAEINAAAIDGLYTLYASTLLYLEDKPTDNVKLIKKYYDELITSSYIFVKKGAPTVIFLMPLADLERAVGNKDIASIMNSAKDFLDVYSKHNGLNRNNDDD